MIKERGPRTPRWVDPQRIANTNDKLPSTSKTQRNEAFRELGDMRKRSRLMGQQYEHGLPLLGERVSGLDTPDNVWTMGAAENASKGNRLPADFDNWKWKHDAPTPGTPHGNKGRLSAWRQGLDGLERVPKSQGGFINAGLLKNVGKVGLLGAGEAALNYFAPDNPINQARERGNGLLSDIGLDLEGAIEGIENPMLRAPAHLANGMFADPFVTALGAGANMGDRIRKEWTGENIRPNITKDGPAMQGRFNQRGLLEG